MAKSVFYSFHYDRDVFRVQQVRNINVLEGQSLLKAQEWESVKEQGDDAIKEWIDKQMNYKEAIIVLVGKETAGRKWINYEINRAWDMGKPLLGICIHGISSMGKTDSPGNNPFTSSELEIPSYIKIPLFDPTVKNYLGKIDSQATYNKLRENLENWSRCGVTK